MYQNNDVVDFVIPLHRYHNMVRTVVEALHTFYNPRVIYMITPLKYVDEINTMSSNWNKNTIIVLPEETFFIKNYGLSIDDIKNLFNNTLDERSREFGWWYQQIIKLVMHPLYLMLLNHNNKFCSLCYLTLTECILSN